MSNGFPCPNPTCTHLFAPDSIEGVAAVNCPRCGTVFQFRNAAPARAKPSPFPPPTLRAQGVPPPPPPPPSAVKPPPLPRTAVAPPVGPGVGFDVAAASIGKRSIESKLSFDEPATSSAPRGKKKRRGGYGAYGSSIIAGFVVLLLIGAAVGAYFYFPEYFSFGDDEQRKGFKTKGNFTITFPGKWKPDDTLRARFRANLAVTRSKPPGHFVLRYRDYEKRLPTDAELFDDALKRLRAYFPQVEYVNPFEQENKGRTSKLGGEPALMFVFKAVDTNQVPMKGECHMLARRGYAYWLFFWGPEDFQDPLAEQFADLRNRFKVYDDREGWKSTPRKTDVVRGETVGFQANYAKEVWKNETQAKDADPAAEVLLRGFEPVEDEATGQTRVERLAGKSAEILVLVLPKAPDLPSAVKAAKEYLRKRAAETNSEAKFEPIADSVVGKDVGAFKGQVDRLRLVLGPDTEKFGLLAVTRRPEGDLVVFGECKWDRRDYWEQEFKAFLETVRPAAKPGK